MGTLTKSLGTDVNSPVSAVAPSSKFFQEELMPSMEQMQTALGTEEKFKKEKSVKEAQQQADILGKDVMLAEEENKKLREDPTRAKYQAAISQKESAAYIPDQENPERLATILALTNLMGVAIGRGGKANAQTALAAQNGMLEGYQKGRADIIKQQKDIFDETQKKLDKTIDDLHRGMQDAAILYAKDKEAGHQKAMLTMAANQASFMKDFYDKNGMGQTYEMSKQIYDMKNKKYEEMKKEEAKNTITPYQQKKLNLEERALKIKEEKATGGGVGALPKDAKTKDEYRARYEVIKNIEDLESLLKDPKYSKFITPLTKFTPDIIANLQQNFPELQSKLARIQAQEFLIGGKALTAGEQKILEPIYGWRGLTADSLRQRLNETKRSIQTTQALNEEIYPGFKDLRPKLNAAYESIGKIPTIPQRNIDQVTYEKNQIIKMGDKSYRVIDDSDPTDPELEEVK